MARAAARRSLAGRPRPYSGRHQARTAWHHPLRGNGKSPTRPFGGSDSEILPGVSLIGSFIKSLKGKSLGGSFGSLWAGLSGSLSVGPWGSLWVGPWGDLWVGLWEVFGWVLQEVFGWVLGKSFGGSLGSPLEGLWEVLGERFAATRAGNPDGRARPSSAACIQPCPCVNMNIATSSRSPCSS